MYNGFEVTIVWCPAKERIVMYNRLHLLLSHPHMTPHTSWLQRLCVLWSLGSCLPHILFLYHWSQDHKPGWFPSQILCREYSLCYQQPTGTRHLKDPHTTFQMYKFCYFSRMRSEIRRHTFTGDIQERRDQKRQGTWRVIDFMTLSLEPAIFSLEMQEVKYSRGYHGIDDGYF